MDGFSFLYAAMLFITTLSIVSFFLSVFNLIENRAISKATHSVQYVDIPYPGTQLDDQGFESISEEVKSKLQYSDDEDFGFN